MHVLNILMSYESKKHCLRVSAHATAMSKIKLKLIFGELYIPEGTNSTRHL